MYDEQYLLKEYDLSNQGLGLIKAITTYDVIKIGEKEYMEFLQPFLLYTQREMFKEVSVFEVLLSDEKLRNLLLLGIALIYRTEEIDIQVDVNNEIAIVVGGNCYINKYNFNKLCEVVLKMVCFNGKGSDDEIDEETIQLENSENQHILEEFKALKKQGRQEQELKNKKHQKSLKQIVTVVASQCNWDYDKVLDMTYYRLINSYSSIFKIDAYNIHLQYASSGQFQMKDTCEYWGETIGKD